HRSLLRSSVLLVGALCAHDPSGDDTTPGDELRAGWSGTGIRVLVPDSKRRDGSDERRTARFRHGLVVLVAVRFVG
ncbi:hypothetical protein ABTK05_19910, partial [Acinetobacter baumannii]